jgi:K+-transporting ATPase ATPase C chain
MTTNSDETQAATVEPPTAAEQEEEREPARRAILRLIRPAIVMTLALTIITGLIYPGVITGLAQLFFPSQANGSIQYVDGKPIGSSLIGQYWTQPQYFHGRPSATNNPQGTPAPYSADNSGASNLGPTNQTLITTVQQRIDDLKKENPDVPPGTPIPADLVTSSGSGLDPDISVAAAYYQIPRVAKARGMTQEQVRNIVDAHVTGRFLGIFGEPRINVLELNLALDGVHPQSSAALSR